MARVGNVVAVADLGGELDLAQLAQRFPDKIQPYNPAQFAGLRVRADTQSLTVTFFRSGRVTVTGARSPLAAKMGLSRCLREFGLGRYASFRVVNLVATWTLPHAKTGTRYIEDPSAFVRISRKGHVFCTGVKSHAELNRVYRLIQ